MARGRTRTECKAALEPLRRRLERWRSSRIGKRERIPEELWKQSAQAGAKYGVAAVAKVLRLDYYSLKSRVKEAPGTRKAEVKAPTFIELMAPVPNARSANTIELQKAGGSKLRIEFQGDLPKEIARLSERLWRASK